MQNNHTTIIITEGGVAPSANKPISSWMRTIRDQITIETLKKLQQCINVTTIVCTDRESIQNYCRENNIPIYNTNFNTNLNTNLNTNFHSILDTNAEDLESQENVFQYLQTLQSVCSSFRDDHSPLTSCDDSALVMGGMALPLASVEQLQYLVDTIAASDQTVWANNPISPDAVGWTPMNAIHDITEVRNDNELSAALRDQAGLELMLWKRELALSYDIDTPIDILLADTREGVKASIEGISSMSDSDPVREKINSLKHVVKQKSLPSLTLIGRVSPQTVQFINQQVKARVRVFSEERGMKGLRRDSEGKVWSLVADWFERFGSYEDAFAELARESDGILVDTRVWMAHHKLLSEMDEEDRFASDLLQVDHIQNAKLKQFTAAACKCSVPVLLGGFGLVNQGIQLLFENIRK